MIDSLQNPSPELLKNAIDNSAQQRSCLNLSEEVSEVCPKCGSKLFTQAMVIKDIPGIKMGLIGTEKIPMPIEQFGVLVCAKCGELAPAMFYDPETKKMVEKLLGEKVDNDNSTNIIT